MEATTIEKTTQSNNLDTFSTLFLVKAILNGLLAFIPLIYVVIGLFFAASPEMSGSEEIPFNIGGVFVAMGLFGVGLIVTLSILTFMASRRLKNRTGFTFIFVVAIINCLTGVLGILLGVFTIIELNKPHVKSLFGRK